VLTRGLTINLDTRNKRKVCELIKGMSESLFISSHNMEFLLETCSRAILIDEGRIHQGDYGRQRADGETWAGNATLSNSSSRTASFTKIPSQWIPSSFTIQL